MKKLSSILFIIFFQLLTAGFSKGNPVGEAIRVELFDVENGISQSAVQAVIQDSYGFLWVGTQNGLNMYDGYTFKKYRNQPLDTTSLIDDYITALCEDRNGNLWIGTFNGLSIYNRSKDSFTHFLFNPGNESSVSSNRIFDIYEDRKGVLWVKTSESLDRFNPETKSFTRFHHFVDVFSQSSDNNSSSLFEDNDNRFWVGTKDGLLLFDRNLGLFKRYSHDPKNPYSLTSNSIKYIYQDSNNNLWIATSIGINLYRERTDDFIRYVHQPENIKSLPDNNVNVLFEDSNGILWVGTDVGFCQFTPQRGEFSAHFNAYYQGKYFYSSTVTSIIEDSSRILWVGTFSGLIKLDLKSQNFKSYSKRPDGSNMFSGNYVASIHKDDDGTIWIGTWGTGLHQFNRKTNTIIQYSESTTGRRICNDYVHVIYRTKKGELIIGTRNGVEVFNEKTKSFELFFKKNIQDANRIFDQNRIYSIIEDNYGKIWFATRMGLHCFNGINFESYFNDPKKPNSLSSNEVHDIVCDNKGNLWAGTFDGLNCINLETKVITRYMQEKVYTQKSLINGEVISLLLDSKGTLWVGTVSGLHRFNESSQTFDLYTERDGLPNNLIYSIEEDNDGNIWFSTNWGLAMLNVTNGSVFSYGVNDGLQSYEYNIGASFKSSNGELFFGGTNGFSSFFPDSIAVNTNIPNLAITNFELFGANGHEVIPVHGLDEIVINQDFSFFKIEFAALDFSRPERNKYMYIMEGIDEEWIDLGTNRSATFSNLDEGIYIFRVKGSNNDNLWNDEGKSLKIIVKTKFWKSKSAFWTYGVIIVVTLIVIVRNRTNNLIKTKRLLREREQTMQKIEGQREELLVKNKSITDSIHYAKRIQESLIPTEDHFRSILPDSFILYLPKDIVSGDFYWINETQNKIFVAVVDCTGHGVPGAFMSIIGVELLRSITNIQGVNDAAEVLNRLSKGVYDTFRTVQADSNVKDTMDVSFCVLDKENNTLQFAGALSNLYIVRDSKIIEIKGDRFSVGMESEEEKLLFKSHFIPIDQDDMIYMFTDGYVDQFGGVDGKKYKYRRFRHLLLNIHKLPFDEQKLHILESISEWRGEYEQVDDILIIGIKPDLSCFF